MSKNLVQFIFSTCVMIWAPFLAAQEAKSEPILSQADEVRCSTKEIRGLAWQAVMEKDPRFKGMAIPEERATTISLEEDDKHHLVIKVIFEYLDLPHATPGVRRASAYSAEVSLNKMCKVELVEMREEDLCIGFPPG